MFLISRRQLSVIAAALVLAACHTPVSEQPPAPELGSGYRTDLTPQHAERHMAAAANPLAAQAGREMLRQGGSAIDAAIAMQAVLTLVEPQSSGIGGGAFIMVWDGDKVHAYDGRETAPAGATERLFLKADGTPMTFTAAQIGGRSVGTPGVLRALEMAHKKTGHLPWAKLFEPAIRLSEQGFAISPRLHALIAADRHIPRSPEMAAYFLNADGTPKATGTLLKNPALANVFKRIAKEGPDALYHGPIADEIARKVQGNRNAGSLSVADLEGYTAKERTPLCSDYKQWTVCGMPPPSSGGIAIAQILGTLQALEARDPGLAIAHDAGEKHLARRPRANARSGAPDCRGGSPGVRRPWFVRRRRRLCTGAGGRSCRTGLPGQTRSIDRRTQHGHRQTRHACGHPGRLRAGPLAAAHLHVASGGGG